MANSTDALANWPGIASSLASKRSSSVNASAVDPANPARILPSFKVLILFTLLLATVFPIVACPSAPIATLPSLSTAQTVVDLVFFISKLIFL